LIKNLVYLVSLNQNYKRKRLQKLAICHMWLWLSEHNDDCSLR